MGAHAKGLCFEYEPARTPGNNERDCAAVVLVVENGSGLAHATSYLSVADATSYIELYASAANQTAWSEASTSQRELALRQATQYLDAVYGPRWKGRRAHEPQALHWPRWDVFDDDGWLVGADVLPRQLLDACAEVALRALTEELVPDLETSGAVKSERVKVGSLETATEYFGGNVPIREYRVVDALLRPLVIVGGSAGRVIRG